MNTLPPDPNLIQSPEPDPFAAELHKFWRALGGEMLRDSLKTLDETARQVIGVAGVLEGLYFHAIAYGDLRGAALTGAEWLVYLAPIVLLLLSLFFALLVFYPTVQPYDLRAWEAAKIIHERAKKAKLRMLRLASLFLLLGVAALPLAVVFYLS